MRLLDYFEKGLETGPDRVAFVDTQTSLTFGEAATVGKRIAAALHAQGLSVDTRAALFSPNDARAFSCLVGMFYAGAVWVPTNARNTVAANAHLLNLTGCEILFYHSALEDEALDLAAAVPSLRLVVCLDRAGRDGAHSMETFTAGATGPAPDVPEAPERITSIFPTGGTTGLSKGARWSQRLWGVMVSAFWANMPSDVPVVHLVAGPMTHAAGGLAVMAMARGGTNVVVPRADPLLIMQTIEQYGITHLYLPPTVLYAMLAHPDVRKFDYSSLRHFVLAAAPCAPEKLREAISVFGPVMCQCYGQAEAPMFITFMPRETLAAAHGDNDTTLFASCGRPSLFVRVAIVDDAGNELPTGERGEIAVSGPLVFDGYLDNPEAMAKAFRKGRLLTGDVGYRDDQGYVYIVDRKKDMIVTGGFNVYSAEVEQVILSHPAIDECAVIGVPDPKWGEAVKAVVEVRQGSEVTPEEIIGLVKAQLGGVHAPKSVEIWPELPRSPAGKVLKRDIRDRYWAQETRAV
ncbi:class I adenylate-forming enzyme family protein [Chachezhania sediminis]|uniref:class I adenylate-forming enzyme family protein n=1 Tax=Chachezhania sediminis TaxID=2599291 RepID=UPI00131AED37|nr:AMP-binding protein [Chachezhania sediminis]